MPYSRKKEFKNKFIITLILSGIFLMEMVDGSALNTSMPKIALGFHVSILNVKAAITVYFLSLGVFIPLCKWLADNFSVKYILLISITSFMIASLGCGFANNVRMLIVCRALQGGAAAFMMPAVRIILVKLFRGEKIIDAMNIIMPVGLVGFMTGPLIGGILTTYYSWRYIFFINLPIFILLLLCIEKYLPVNKIKPVKKSTAFDTIGFLLFSSSIGLILLSLDKVSHVPLILSFSNIIIFIFGIIFSYVFYLHCNRCGKSIIDAALFSLKKFMLGTYFSFLSRCISGAIPFIIPVMLQLIYHKTPIQSGYVIFYIAAGMIVSRLLVKKYITNLSYKVSLIISLLFMLIIQIYWAFLINNDSLQYFSISLFLYGFVLTILLSTIDTNIYKSISNAHTNDGVIVHSIAVQLTNSFSIALSSIILACSMRFISHTKYLVRENFLDLFLFLLILPFLSILICLIESKDPYVTDRKEVKL